ncbi:hypothetical protein VW29_18670 [Devosia limi DSM 17137]|uniref:DnaJ domain-containing protein n=1 Tax=Devosia limi DSM 17137 TaxID=1121477 RepID=A0A0F5L4U6_9HYPH|nr:DnaJ domain-containing protein [Devosia limi]KKB77378.1 hypothetical protein VW29_18670 [Devosia limi DSM 17137]SHE68492.1 DnaJ domain-containing protein [Devosia limi DSM 17137]
MTYFFIGGIVLLAVLAAYQAFRNTSPQTRSKTLRWGVGGGAAVLAALLLIARRVDLAAFLGVAAASILRTGRLGPFDLEKLGRGPDDSDSDVSKVRSRYFAMELDHDSGAVHGMVRAGQFAGEDLMNLGEDETRALIQEIVGDPDSVSLLESWLDANRAGWREYFEEQARGGGGPGAAGDPVEEAYAVLGLQPGASDEDIRAAHRELMKGVHPDHGGSSYLASKINEARDLLLKR